MISMGDSPSRVGATSGAQQRPREDRKQRPTVSRCFYLKQATVHDVTRVANSDAALEDRWWTLSRTADALIQLGLLAFRDGQTGELDLERLRPRLAHVEMESELRRLGATQEV